MSARPALIALVLWLGQAGAWACSSCNQPAVANTSNYYPLVTLLMIGMVALVLGGCAYFLYRVEHAAAEERLEPPAPPLPGEGALS